MSEQQTSAKDPDILQILITEHSNLQTARSATVFEANGIVCVSRGCHTISSITSPPVPHDTLESSLEGAATARHERITLPMLASAAPL
jgi:hypothetical protein